MINFDDDDDDDDDDENIKENISTRPQIPDNPYRVFIFGATGFRKTNPLFNLISHKLDIDKNYLDAKASKAFIKCQNDTMIFTNIWQNTIQIRNAKY